MQGVGLEFMDGGWQKMAGQRKHVPINICSKKSQYSPLERGIDLTLTPLLVIMSMLLKGALGEVGFVGGGIRW